jgi:hypothetical protein
MVSPGIPLSKQLAEVQKHLENAIAMVAPGEWAEPMALSVPQKCEVRNQRWCRCW